MKKEKNEKLAEISARIMKVIEYLGETPNSFASKLGYARAQTIYDIRDMKSAPSYDFFQKFSNSEFSVIVNTDWLLAGKGEMIKPVIEDGFENLPSVNQDCQGSPYYNVDFIGGFDALMNDQTINPDFYINYPPYNKEDVVWVNLTGRSMEPELSQGDIIALKPVTTPIEYLPFGEIYAIVTDEYRTVKRIRLSERPGYIWLIPSNTAPDYQEQEIPIDMITKVYAVLGSIRKFF